MAHPKALSEGELHSQNFKAIRSWLAANKGRIKAPPNKTVLYSGRDDDLEDLVDELGKKVSPEQRATFMGTPMWKVVARWQKTAKATTDAKVGQGYKALPDVLKTLDPPRLTDKDHQPLHYPNAWAFFDDLDRTRDLDPYLPNRKKVAVDVWRELSDIFASNAEGDLKIFDGVADDYGKLREDKVLILKELPALLKNPKLSKEAKDLLKTKITRFGSHFDRRYTELMRQLDEGRTVLKGK